MSSDITTKLIKELRDATGISVMQCKNALEEAEGDIEKAVAILKKISSDVALKKAGRDASDGRVTVNIKGNKGVLIALHCETDFVSKNDDFTRLLSQLASKALEEGVVKMKNEAKEMIDSIIQKTGEKIELGEVYEITGETLGSYVHNNKAGVIVSLTGGNADLAKDIAMHITAMKPEYITFTDITDEAKKTMTEVFEKEVSESDKPEEIKKKMLDGKMNTYFKEKTLMSQTFIKDQNETIESLLQKNNAKVKEVKRYFI